jgi:hypothetical protein
VVYKNKMALEDLNKELYGTDSGATKRTHKETPFDPRLAAKASPSSFQRAEVWAEKNKGLGPNQKNAIHIALWSIGGIAVLALLIGGIYLYNHSAFSADRVTVAIEGPANIDSTQVGEYKIHYKNNNRAKLANAEMILNYSENFQPDMAENFQILSAESSKIHIGEIAGHAEKEILVKGRFYAPQDSLVYLKAVLEYNPANSNSKFQAQNQLGVSVKTSPIFLEITAPLEAADGNDVEYLLDYRNSSTRNFGETRIKVDFPSGFQFTSADPRPSESNNFWYVGNLGPNEGGKIRIEGKLAGATEEGKIIKSYVGTLGNDGKFVTFTQDEKITKMVSSPLSIVQSVNGLQATNINSGQTLYYTLKYSNKGQTGLRDVIITLDIQSAVLDYSKLKLDKGSYDSSRETITWKASDFPVLAKLDPGKEGEVQFSVPVLDNIPVKTTNDKNFTVVTLAKIDSPDVPSPLGSNKIIASNRLELELNSKIVLDTLGYYKDQKIENSGPVPPQVGKETSYTFHWSITNVSNDVSDVKVVSSLPTGVKWTGKTSPDSENMSYNERTNQIVWEVGKLKNAVGILDPKREVVFQVSIIPQVNQIDREAPLLNPSVLTAKDLFTTEDLRVETKEKNTLLPEDASISVKYKVVGAGS